MSAIRRSTETVAAEVAGCATQVGKTDWRLWDQTAWKVTAMTGEQSRLLRVGDRVRWGGPTADFGTVIGTAWSGVTIAWDDGVTDFSSTQRHEEN